MTLKNVILVGCFIFALDSVASAGRERSDIKKIREQTVFTKIFLEAFNYQNAGCHVTLYNRVSIEDCDIFVDINLNNEPRYRKRLKHANFRIVTALCSAANSYLINSTPENSQKLRNMLGMSEDIPLNRATLQRHFAALKDK